MSECIFCKIADGVMESDIVYQDADAVGLRDLNAQAPTHILVIPRKHIGGIKAARPEDDAILGHCLLVARNLALSEGLADTGYRIVINSGKDAGETVPHLHVHLLGGRPFAWPPG